MAYREPISNYSDVGRATLSTSISTKSPTQTTHTNSYNSTLNSISSPLLNSLPWALATQSAHRTSSRRRQADSRLQGSARVGNIHDLPPRSPIEEYDIISPPQKTETLAYYNRYIPEHTAQTQFQPMPQSMSLPNTTPSSIYPFSLPTTGYMTPFVCEQIFTRTIQYRLSKSV